MKDKIICFSGTGNSYYVAKKIAEFQNHDNIVMVNELEKNFELPERLGFIFPVYVSREPIFIENKIREVFSQIKDFKKLQFVYVITTAGTNSYGFSHIRFEKMLKDFGVATTYVNNIKMPNNLINPISQEKAKELYIEADKKLEIINNDLLEEKFKFPKFRIFTRTFSNITYLFIKYFTRHYSENFVVNDDCNGCGLCYESCPANNITMENGKPVFHDNCYACTACINNCPKQAIDKKNKKKIKYTNPNGYFYHKYRSL
ncbi:MAG: EFR1 family ferrodoxin [Pleomorphochaeta sp.]